MLIWLPEATIPVMADSSSVAPDPISEDYNVTGFKHNGSSFIVIASSASTGIMSVCYSLELIIIIYESVGA